MRRSSCTYSKNQSRTITVGHATCLCASSRDSVALTKRDRKVVLGCEASDQLRALSGRTNEAHRGCTGSGLREGRPLWTKLASLKLHVALLMKFARVCAYCLSTGGGSPWRRRWTKQRVRWRLAQLTRCDLESRGESVRKRARAGCSPQCDRMIAYVPRLYAHMCVCMRRKKSTLTSLYMATHLNAYRRRTLPYRGSSHHRQDGVMTAQATESQKGEERAGTTRRTSPPGCNIGRTRLELSGRRVHDAKTRRRCDS